MKLTFFAFGRLLAAMLLGLLPTGGKRAMYLTSIYFYLAREGVFRAMTLTEFNVASTLNIPVESLSIPMKSMDFLWKRTGIASKVREELSTCSAGDCQSYSDVERAAKEIVLTAHRGIKYDHARMMQDTVRLFYMRAATA